MLSEKVFDFTIPVRVHFEVGGLAKVGAEIKALGGSNILICTDKGLVAAGLLGGLTDALEAEGLPYTVFDEVEVNPGTETIERGAALVADKGCDLIVGIGGGSPLDSAKAIALLTNNPGPLTQYEGPDKVPNPVMPVVAIPTTAGTGSEINGSTVITDKVRRYKMSIRSGYLVPGLALLDPSLLSSLPPKVIAATGMDALVHAIESYISLLSSPASEGLAIESIRLIGDNLRTFQANPADIEAAGNMLMASAMACMSFSNARLGVIHGIAHVLGGRYNIPHGVACAVLLPYTMEMILDGAPEKFSRVAGAMGADVSGLDAGEGAKASVEAVWKLMKDLEMPTGLSGLGAKAEDIDQIVADALSSGMHLTTPLKMDEVNTAELIRAAM